MFACIAYIHKMVGKKRQEKESVCEKSMQNIIKLSSFSLATMNLRGIKPFTTSFSSSSKSKRSEAPLNKSYLMEEEDAASDHRNFSDYIQGFHRKTKNTEENTDGKASAYIRKFHHRNSPHFTLAASPLLLPPPPPPPSSINK